METLWSVAVHLPLAVCALLVYAAYKAAMHAKAASRNGSESERRRGIRDTVWCIILFLLVGFLWAVNAFSLFTVLV